MCWAFENKHWRQKPRPFISCTALKGTCTNSLMQEVMSSHTVWTILLSRLRKRLGNPPSSFTDRLLQTPKPQNTHYKYFFTLESQSTQQINWMSLDSLEVFKQKSELYLMQCEVWEWMVPQTPLCTQQTGNRYSHIFTEHHELFPTRNLPCCRNLYDHTFLSRLMRAFNNFVTW